MLEIMAASHDVALSTSVKSQASPEATQALHSQAPLVASLVMKNPPLSYPSLHLFLTEARKITDWMCSAFHTMLFARKCRMSTSFWATFSSSHSSI
mmetsp:Transcript_14033/g.23995  ORF Transcript_14033/g.23995 Transcript_14033/m.23995 type:complete len:96 (+) Transcript_14033:1174-1461(+)